jgi:CubicO group peptidase (beta-lactamase class C family)
MLDALAGRSAAWLGQSSASWLVRDRPGGTLRAGFDGKAHAGSSAGKRSGPRTFGHLGFTGTSLWCDPDADVAVALLSNRVNAKQEREAPTIRDVRPEVHDLLFGLAERWKTAPRD